MANRAYLFSPDDEDYLLERGDEYYDSRWNIPLLWFLFFDENSLMMLSREDDSDDVLETFLIEKKYVALERFQNNISKLEIVLDISKIDIQKFVENLKRWEGEHLVLDSMEIIQSDGENTESETIKDFSNALKYLSNGEINKYLETFTKYAGSFDEIDNKNPQEIQNYLIGFTYW